MQINPNITSQQKLYNLTVINMFGGPGCAKSSTAAGIFYNMKKLHYDVEFAYEAAKELVWEQRHITLQQQDYVSAEQHRRLYLLRDKVQFVVTDCPILMGCVYADHDEWSGLFPHLFKTFHKYRNINVLLKRDPSVLYQARGRNQSYIQSLADDQKIQDMLVGNNIEFIEAAVNGNIAEELIQGELGYMIEHGMHHN